MAVHQNVDPVVAPDVDMQLIGIGISITGAAGSSMFGHPCATKATSVGAIDWVSYTVGGKQKSKGCVTVKA